MRNAKNIRNIRFRRPFPHTTRGFKKHAESYSISQVPTIIIRESHAVDANLAKSVAQMINIVDYLLKEVTSP